MKRFTIPCEFGKVKAPFHIYLGQPRTGIHPLQNQARWLSNERGGEIPEVIMGSFEKLRDIAAENGVIFEDLATWALTHTEEKRLLNAKDCDPALSKILELSKVVDLIEKYHKTPVKDDEITELRPIPTEASRRRLFGERYKKFQKKPDTLIKATYAESVAFIYRISAALWPEYDRITGGARMLFLGLGLSTIFIEDSPATLETVYKSVMADDPNYAFVVTLDAAGALLPSLSYSLIAQWLNSEKLLRQSSLDAMKIAFIDFAFGKSSAKDKLNPMRKALRGMILAERKI